MRHCTPSCTIVAVQGQGLRDGELTGIRVTIRASGAQYLGT